MAHPARSGWLWLPLLAAVAVGCTTAPPTAGPAPATGRGYDSVHAVAFLDTLERRTFDFFWERTNPATGLTPDRWPTRSFSSIAAVGFALTGYPIGADRGWISRTQAAERSLVTLKFLWSLPQGPAPNGVAGHRGLFYHFLDQVTGLRFETVELSTIDTALLMAGVLFSREYFDGADPSETSIRAYADSLYRRVDWAFAQRTPPLINMGWKPEEGLLSHDWRGYNEAMLVYVLALGSPTFPVDSTAWRRWTETYRWGGFQGSQEHVGFAPLFGHQYSHVWIDFRGIRDEYLRDKGIDYFENSRRATLAQQAYAIANPHGWRGYGARLWGLTASDGPIDREIDYAGQPRRFFTYAARGASFEEVRDDGTIAPTAAGGSIAFAPEIVIPTLLEMRVRYGEWLFGEYGFLDAFNPSFQFAIPVQHGRVVPGVGWFDGDYLGIDQGPILAMIANHRRDFVWKYMRRSAPIRTGLARAGFTGGWLDRAP